MAEMLSQQVAVIPLLEFVADRYNTDPITDIVNMGKGTRLLGILREAAGGTGTAKLQAFACSDATNSGNDAEAITFRWKETAAAGLDVFSAALSAPVVPATGHTTTAGAAKTILAEVDARDCPVGKPYVYFKLTEVANDPVLAGMIGILSGIRYGGDPLATVLT